MRKSCTKGTVDAILIHQGCLENSESAFARVDEIDHADWCYWYQTVDEQLLDGQQLFPEENEALVSDVLCEWNIQESQVLYIGDLIQGKVSYAIRNIRALKLLQSLFIVLKHDKHTALLDKGAIWDIQTIKELQALHDLCKCSIWYLESSQRQLFKIWSHPADLVDKDILKPVAVLQI